MEATDGTRGAWNASDIPARRSIAGSERAADAQEGNLWEPPVRSTATHKSYKIHSHTKVMPEPVGTAVPVPPGTYHGIGSTTVLTPQSVGILS